MYSFCPLTEIGYLLETTNECRQFIDYRPESHSKMLISLMVKLQGKAPPVTLYLQRQALQIMRARCGIEYVLF